MILNAVDINCDTGEGIGNEEKILPLITRCSIACGGHYGDEKTILEVLKLAKEYKVKVGAHPSYPDRLNFGRKVMSFAIKELENSITEQLLLFKKCTEMKRIKVSHIKPHGALYNEAQKNEEVAAVIVRSCFKVFKDAAILTPWQSALAKHASQMGTAVIYEAFGDRNYNDDLSLVSRTDPEALIEKPEAVLNHILHILINKEVLTIHKKRIPLKANTFCIHGDTPNAEQILKYLKNKLPDSGWKVSL